MKRGQPLCLAAPDGRRVLETPVNSPGGRQKHRVGTRDFEASRLSMLPVVFTLEQTRP
jgi:hypothetical protein